MTTLVQVEQILEGDVAPLPTRSLKRGRLLDMATALSLTARSLAQYIEYYSDVAGAEDDAREAKRLLQKVQRSIFWLQAFSDVATEDELYHRVLTAHCYSHRTLSLVRNMQNRHDEVWAALMRMHRLYSEAASN